MRVYCVLEFKGEKIEGSWIGFSRSYSWNIVDLKLKVI